MGIFQTRNLDGQRVSLECSLETARQMVNRFLVVGGIWRDGVVVIYL
jgi:hypothetical protein